MLKNHLYRWFYFLLVISLLFTTCTDGKGFGRGGGFKGGGSRGSFGGSKGAGTFGGSSSYNRGNSFGKPSSGSSFKKNAMSFGAGALGGVAAYSLMSSMSRSYRPGHYSPGYGTGQTCTNNQDINGTRFGQFRCPLDGFSYDAKYCCGSAGEQYCCTYDEYSYSGNSRSTRSSSSYSLFWIGIIVVIIMVAIIVVAKRRQQSSKDLIMVPVEPPLDEQRPAFYQPAPPPMGYPPPPMGYPPPPMNYPPNVNPYAPPPQNYDGTYTPYPPQQQMPYPPHQQPYNPYQVREGGPPVYNDGMQNNQGMPTTRPM